MAQATGYFKLKPSEFWDLTPREYENMAAGFQMNEDIEWQRTAQLASWIMSAQLGKKTPTADKLLGKETKQRKERTNKAVSIEEKRSTLSELEESLGEAVN